MTERTYWIWAQLALGIPCESGQIFSVFAGAQELYNATDAERRMSGCFNAAQIERMETCTLDEAIQVEALCEKRGWSILVPTDGGYPGRLNSIPDYPLALYVWGTLPDTNETPSIAMVGARKCSGYGMRVADTFARRFAQLGAVVVSGGALGVDAAAHKGAVLGGGKTIAVLGCGLGTPYLQENRSLREVISKNGAVIAEYPPMTPAAKYTFPVRNRLISGLSHGVLVVEAGLKSGSIITARLAAEQGREVFAVPGGVLSAAYEGTNRLLKDGVTPAFTPEEVLEQCARQYPLNVELPKQSTRFHLKNVDLTAIDSQAERQGVAQRRLKSLPPQTAEVYHLLTFEPQYVDELCRKAGASNAEVLCALTQLELAGLAAMLPGKAYILKANEEI